MKKLAILVRVICTKMPGTLFLHYLKDSGRIVHMISILMWKTKITPVIL